MKAVQICRSGAALPLRPRSDQYLFHVRRDDVTAAEHSTSRTQTFRVWRKSAALVRDGFPMPLPNRLHPAHPTRQFDGAGKLVLQPLWVTPCGSHIANSTSAIPMMRAIQRAVASGADAVTA